MTAKRFKLVEYLPNVIRIEDNHQKLNSHEIVDLLNELHEEKEELIDALNQRTEQCDKLHEENQRLRNKVATYKTANRLLKKTFEKE
jgi:uncharacterized membrane-anchored protein YhcB (DUF1043 family)